MTSRRSAAVIVLKEAAAVAVEAVVAATAMTAKSIGLVMEAVDSSEVAGEARSNAGATSAVAA